MKKINPILGSIGCLVLLVACGGAAEPASQATMAPTATRFALPATWTQSPTKTQSPSATPRPVQTSAPLSPTATQTPPVFGTPTPDPALAWLPEGARPLRDQGWAVSTQPESPLAAFPYEMPDGSLGLALVDDFERGANVRWTWHQDPLAAGYTWTRMRRLARTVNQSVLLFLAQDTQDQWMAGALYAPAGETPQVLGLVPVQDPQGVYVVVTYFAGRAWEFWVLEKQQLHLYQWQDGVANALWDLSDVPHDAVFPAMDADTDVTGDGVPELWLRWWPWTPGKDWASSVAFHSYYVADGLGYRNVGNFPDKVQRQDVDHDGVEEFLLPDLSVTPTEWNVIEWNGAEFVEDRRISMPQGPVPQVPKLSQLPALGADLYFVEGGAHYLWAQAGGALQIVDAPPGTPCSEAAFAQEVVSWAPGCGAAVVKIPRQGDGYSLGLIALGATEPVEIPNTLSQKGHSSFGWDPAGSYVLHGRAGDNPGLYRVWLGGGQAETIVALSAWPGDLFGVSAPAVLPDGSFGFAIQGQDEGQYPPFGIYRMVPGGEWYLLADLPALHTDDPEKAPFGNSRWSLDGSLFLFHAPFQGGQEPPYGSLLLGMADGSAVWDLNPILGDASDFFWK
ncbi:MAG: hypothetical protein ACOYYS_28055 [Chloroflexota bacterium]